MTKKMFVLTITGECLLEARTLQEAEKKAQKITIRGPRSPWAQPSVTRHVEPLEQRQVRSFVKTSLRKHE